MGTKRNPGEFDCYAKAEPDEPLFILRGKDVSAPYLVEIWTAVRRGEATQAGVIGHCSLRPERLACRASFASHAFHPRMTRLHRTSRSGQTALLRVDRQSSTAKP